MRLLRLLIGAILVFALLVVGGLFLLPGDRIARLAADELTRRTGREVRIAGEANVTLWPDLGVTVGALSIANADWSDNGPLFQAKSVTIGVDAAALIRKDIRIRALHADNPQILLERNAQGVANWDLAPKPAPGSAPATPAPAAAATPAAPVPAFTLDRAEITDAAIFFVDRQAGTEVNQRGIDLILAYPRANGPADIDLTLRPAGEPIRLTGTLADPVALAGSAVSDVTLDIKAPGATGRFDGRVSLRPEVQGQIALDSSDTATLARALGQAIAPLPRGLGRDLKLNGALTLTRDGALALRDTLVTSGPNTLAVAADLATGGARPRLTAQLVTEALDLTSLGGDSTGTGPAPAGTPATGWSTAPIDASALGLLDAEVSLSAKTIALGTTTLGTTRALITVDRARAVASLREVQAFGGTLTGEFVANNRNGLSVGGDLQASAIALQQMLSELAGITRFTGDASARLQFLGVGQSLAAIMNSLSGEGRIDTGRGTIEGIDLDRLFRGGDPTGGTTIFDATTATFGIAEGVLSNRDLLMKLAGIEARGDGTIGLGKQQIDYLFTPVSLKARDGRGLALPVRIRGAWADPKITVDVEKAIELNAAEEKAKVEQKVKDEVAKKLGIEQQQGESAEDALKRKLEEEAKKGLLKLLNR